MGGRGRSQDQGISQKEKKRGGVKRLQDEKTCPSVKTKSIMGVKKI